MAFDEFGDFEEGVAEAPERIGVMGDGGAGKTSLVAGAPRPIFLDLEGGSLRIPHIARNKSPIATFDGLLERVRWLRTQKHSFQTVVIDTLDKAEWLIWQKLCARDGVESIEQVSKGFGKGYTAAYEEMRRLFGELDGLSRDREMHVALVMHTKLRTVKNPSGFDYSQHAPRMHDTVGNAAFEFCDHFLYVTRDTTVSEKAFDEKRARAIGGTNRIIRTTGTPTYVAKVRAPVPDPIPLSWHEFVCHLANAGFARLLKDTVRDNARRTGDPEVIKSIEKALSGRPSVAALAGANARLMERLGGHAWQQAAAKQAVEAAVIEPEEDKTTPAAEPVTTTN